MAIVPFVTAVALAQTPSVNLELVNEPVVNALTRVATFWHKPIYVSPAVRGFVTLNIQEVPADVAVRQILALCDKQKLICREVGDSLLISPAEDPFTIDRIEVQGNSRISTDTVLRNLRTTQGSLIDVQRIQSDAQRLRALGFFRRVDVNLERAIELSAQTAQR